MTHDWEPEPLPLAEALRAAARDRDNSKHFPEAKIASNLEPVADGYVGPETVISVVGYDLPNVVTEGYRWLDDLKKWLGRGAQVRYLAQVVSPIARERLASLVAAYPQQFSARLLVPSEAWSSFEHKLLTQWKTFHFVVFEKQPQLWLEMYHPPGSCEAQDCFYFAPARAGVMTLHTVCKERFEHMFALGLPMEEALAG